MIEFTLQIELEYLDYVKCHFSSVNVIRSILETLGSNPRSL